MLIPTWIWTLAMVLLIVRLYFAAIIYLAKLSEWKDERFPKPGFGNWLGRTFIYLPLLALLLTAPVKIGNWFGPDGFLIPVDKVQVVKGSLSLSETHYAQLFASDYTFKDGATAPLEKVDSESMLLVNDSDQDLGYWAITLDYIEKIDTNLLVRDTAFFETIEIIPETELIARIPPGTAYEAEEGWEVLIGRSQLGNWLSDEDLGETIYCLVYEKDGAL